jgi:hypothetical protein
MKTMTKHPEIKHKIKQMTLGANGLLLISLTTFTCTNYEAVLAQANNQTITQVNASFVCGKSGNQWTTLVNASSRPNEEVPLIVWQSNAFAGARIPNQNNKNYNNQQRCQLVSERLNNLFRNKQLEFITSGTVGGATVICGTRSNRETCTANNIIFTLREQDQAAPIIKQFYDLQRGLSTGPIYQANRSLRVPTHIRMKEVVLNAPGRGKRK